MGLLQRLLEVEAADMERGRAGGAKGRVQKFKKRLMETFDEHFDSVLYTLKSHILDPRVEYK